MTTTTDQRTSYIAGLRILADLLEQQPDLKLPYDGITSPIAVFTHDREDLVAWAKALPGQADKKYDDDRNFGFELHGAVGGLDFVVYGKREQVCERVVTGTETVTKTVPDPEALAKVPSVEVTETVEKVEWVCRPLLADAIAAEAV